MYITRFNKKKLGKKWRGMQVSFVINNTSEDFSPTVQSVNIIQKINFFSNKQNNLLSINISIIIEGSIA